MPIDWNQLALHTGLGSLGALVLVALRCFQLRGEMDADRYNQMWRSIPAWIVFIGGIVASGIVTALFFQGTTGATLWQLALCGGAAPAFFAQAVGAFKGNQPPKGGTEQLAASRRFGVMDIFRYRPR